MEYYNTKSLNVVSGDSGKLEKSVNSAEKD
jgi:hypothetical protein